MERGQELNVANAQIRTFWTNKPFLAQTIHCSSIRLRGFNCVWFGLFSLLCGAHWAHLHRGHTSGCVCHVPRHFVLKTSLHFPKYRAQNVNGILELSLMSPQEMSDAYAPSVAVWFLFQTHQFLRQIGSRVGHFANCPPCMVGIRPRCPSLAKAPSHGCFAHSSLWVCWPWKPDFPFTRSPLVRAPVPEEQIQFRTHQAPDIIVAFAVHFSTISHDDPLAVALSSPSSWGPSGDHLVASLQEALTPPHILSQMEVWLSSQVATFRAEGAPPVPHSPPVDPVTEVHSPPVPSPFAPLPHTVHLSPTASPRSPFPSVRTHALLHGAVVSKPICGFWTRNTSQPSPRHFLALDPFVSPDSWRCHATSIMPL